MPGYRTLICLILLNAGLAGCNDARPETAQNAPSLPTSPASSFDAARTGAIKGHVLWEGPLPQVPPFRLEAHRFAGKEMPRSLRRDNPNAPVVDPESKGLAQAIVCLRGVDAGKARPWDLPAVRIELRDLRLHIYQGDKPVRTAFVRQRTEVAMVSRDHSFHSLHGDGADFFTFTFVDRDWPRTRRLDHKGPIELSSAAGYWWMRGYLWVSDHSYVARTDHRGRFHLTGVPPGRYQLACWLPNWKIARRDRDPETMLVSRIFYASPLEQLQTVNVEAGKTSGLDFSVSGTNFPSPQPLSR